MNPLAPLSAAVCAGGRTLTEPCLSPDGSAVAFVARDARAACVVVVDLASVFSSRPERDLSEHRRAGWRVVAGDAEPAGRGGVLAWLADSRRLAYVTRSGDVAVAHGGGGARLVASGIEGGASALAASPDGSRLAFVADTRAVCVVGVDGGPVEVVGDMADFALDPSWSPDGERLVWQEWDVPAMPWGAARIVIAPVAPTAPAAPGAPSAAAPVPAAPGAPLAPAAGGVPRVAADGPGVPRVASAGGGVPRVAPAAGGEPRVAPAAGGVPRVVAGGPDMSVQEPRFAPDGTALAFLSDADGWLNLWVAGPDGGGARPLVREEHEHGGAVWGGGQRSYAWSPDSESIAFTRNEGGFGRLCVVDVASGAVRELSRGVHSSITWAGGTIACMRSGARTPTSVVAIDAVTGERRVVATGPHPDLAAVAKSMPEPEVVEWPAPDGAVVHGRLWRPPAGAAGDGPPPLLVWAHGGPTDQRQVTFDARLAFFATRGWAVLHPDPRGSTGWGRSWAQGIRERWGEVDVEDVAAGAHAAVERGWADPARMVAMGGSAGGMTALLLAARDPALWAAVVALYPVVDLLGLAAATHRFEAHYTVGLVGPLPETAERHRARSPLARADRITAPVLLLHGSADQVVPPAQSAGLAAILRAKGVVVEHHEYDGEGHGWRSPSTVEDELERIAAFLARVGLAPGTQS